MISVSTPRHLMDKSVAVLVRTELLNTDGTPAAVWSAPATALTLRCLVVPQTGGDALAFQGEGSVEAYRVIADPVPLTGTLGTNLDAHSKVTYNGNTYRVSGTIRNPAEAGTVLAFNIERDV